MMRTDWQFSIKDELIYRTSRSSGPGGQHVNKTESRVELLWDLNNSAQFSEIEKHRLKANLANRLTNSGIITIACDSSRSQVRNKAEVTSRFIRLLESGLKVKRARKKTRPTKKSIEKRLTNKKYLSEKKQSRKRGWS